MTEEKQPALKLNLDVDEREMLKISRRSFLWAGVAGASAIGGIWWLGARELNRGIPWPLRRMLGLNEKIAEGYFRGYRLAPEFPEALATERINGDVGLDGDVDEKGYVVRVMGLHDMSHAVQEDASSEPAVSVPISAIRALPAVTMVTELKCIEGWSVVVKWKGARLRDFAAMCGPQTRSLSAPDIDRKPEDLLPYVALETPDGSYYVGIDIMSALHPQTLLCYEMNGRPLTNEHGAPLRLVIPVKYGVKNLKRIGSIRFTDRRPRDYWEERGYYWYAGL